MFEATIAGSLPKPGWLAETDKLWPQWKLAGADLAAAKRDATLLWLKEQEDAGLDIVGDGEQSRQHFVHGFLEFVDGIDFEHKVEMGIRKDRYKAMVPQVVGPLKLKGRVHQVEAKIARSHTKKKLKITLPGPMTIVDTVADRYYGDALAYGPIVLANPAIAITTTPIPAPSAISPINRARIQPTLSPRTNHPIKAANTVDVSRNTAASPTLSSRVASMIDPKDR